MHNIDRLFRREVVNMRPYSPIEPPDQIAKRLGLPERDIIKYLTISLKNADSVTLYVFFGVLFYTINRNL